MRSKSKKQRERNRSRDSDSKGEWRVGQRDTQKYKKRKTDRIKGKKEKRERV